MKRDLCYVRDRCLQFRQAIAAVTLSWIWLLAGCANLNVPRCKLGAGVMPVPPAHPDLAVAPRWSTFDGTQFPYTYWPSRTGQTKGTVIVFPGWDSTMGDYPVMGQYLTKRGYEVYGSEQRTGIYDPKRNRRGNPTDPEDWVRDAQAFTSFVARRNGGAPIYYFGHSFGGIVSLAATQESPPELRPKGVIVESIAMPLLIDGKSFVKAVLLMPFASWRIPHVRLAENSGKDPTGIPRVSCQWWHSSDRVREGYKMRYLVAAAKVGHQVRKHSREYQFPVLALTGEKDVVIAANEKSKKELRAYLTEELCNGRAKVISYSNGHHSMILSPTGDANTDGTTGKLLRDVVAWLDARGGGGRTLREGRDSRGKRFSLERVLSRGAKDGRVPSCSTLLCRLSFPLH
jgi:alpha-beta hydrolase superfamily lysophospholipase